MNQKCIKENIDKAKVKLVKAKNKKFVTNVVASIRRLSAQHDITAIVDKDVNDVKWMDPNKLSCPNYFIHKILLEFPLDDQ